ncbi:hypothetical protein VE25_07550 [Devosia geojensis]|uniref:Methane oxygenase PmoA n=1 Tax=Devosia geojensis TaxID=443610 RepID=A0A0F5FW23_9HYPH|nr:DUF6807 family protein [Devosia geojensis]KKB12397.1 hypothetical protein VE25_07550 [Devosia geojensis]
MSEITITVSQDRENLVIARGNGQEVLVHRIPAAARPTIHPIVAPDGNGILTEDRPGHHPWQRGLYTGFNLVNGVGFWRDEPQDGDFAPRLLGEPVASGNTARWTIANRWTHPDGTPLIDEVQGWSLAVENELYVFDLTWTLNALEDVVIGQFMAGGLFLRMPWTPEKGARALNSNGLADKDGEKQRADWQSVWMPIDGRSDGAGMAIMDHPSNPAHPTTWRVDNEFGISPSRVIAESWKIESGSAETYRFRVLTFTGPIVPDDIQRVWKDFAEMATAEQL